MAKRYRCPNCTRFVDITQKSVTGIIRCQHCNWKVKLPRSNDKPTPTKDN